MLVLATAWDHQLHSYHTSKYTCTRVVGHEVHVAPSHQEARLTSEWHIARAVGGHGRPRARGAAPRRRARAGVRTRRRPGSAERARRGREEGWDRLLTAVFISLYSPAELAPRRPNERLARARGLIPWRAPAGRPGRGSAGQGRPPRRVAWQLGM